MRHECAVHDCGRSIVAGLLMCKQHWFQVSARTRAEVNHTWQKRKITERTNPRYLDHLRAYRSAKAMALLEVAGLQRNTEPAA